MNTKQQINVSETEAANRQTPTFANRLATQLEQVKREVYAQFQSALSANEQLLRLALIEADAIAHQTQFPELVFPLLATEKAQNAARWQSHQQFRLRENTAYALSA